MSKHAIREIERAIDRWVLERGETIRRDDHSSLAEAVYEGISHRLRKKAARKGLLVDLDEAGDYCNPRLVDNADPEEMLYPEDPETEEPVDEAVAHFALSLPDPSEIPDI